MDERNVMAWAKFHAFLIDIELDQLGSYVRKIDRVLAEELRELDARYSKEVPVDLEQDAYRDDWYSDKATELGEDFPTICNNATFVAVYSFLEHELFQTCSHLRHAKKYTLSPRDLRDRGIDQAKNYLAKVAGVESPWKTPEWTAIKTLQEIRNRIVHARGYIPPKPTSPDTKDDFAAARQLLGSCIMKEHEKERITLTKDFCLMAIETVKQFFSRLYDAMPEK